MSDVQSITRYREIEGFPGYRVGDDGSVWTLWRRSGRGRGRGALWVIGDEWKRLKPGRIRSGHLLVNLHPGAHTRRVHQLVLEAFVGPRPDGTECCHEDGDPAENRLSNLRWDTHAANGADMLRHGTQASGERNGRAKLGPDEVREIRRAHAAGEAGNRALARRFDVSAGAITLIVTRRRWAHVP